VIVPELAVCPEGIEIDESSNITKLVKYLSKIEDL